MGLCIFTSLKSKPTIVMKSIPVLLFFLISYQSFSQDYFLINHGPYDPDIPSPEQFLGYPIGEQQTRHDRIVAYFYKLAELSERATIIEYGKTHESRPLIILTVSSQKNLESIDELQQKHMTMIDPETKYIKGNDQPVFVNLGYNVHGNEPSGAEAAMLTAYTLVASQNEIVQKYRQNAILFIDPVINPDGRDRHTQWVNTYKGNPKVADPNDIEHNEAWPGGRTNHYWFDLNRDWLLGINPESRGKLNWYHQWYPNVVTDFHEMGTNSTYFFEPMKPNASKDPIMPKENYTTLNDIFAKYFVVDLDSLGSLYYTKESFDGTYPGYGSSYPDLQGGLALLFEQASSRGSVQETPMGKITFAFTIRNQFTSSMATIRAAVENKEVLFNYQKDFFKSGLTNASTSKIKGYVFGDQYDENRTRSFIDKLLLHRIKVYSIPEDMKQDGKTFYAGNSYFVPTHQPQYRMVQTVFETYDEYADSVFYDASAWSLANFYNMTYTPVYKNVKQGEEVTWNSNIIQVAAVKKTHYAYILPWEDYYVPAALYCLQNSGVKLKSAFKPFTIPVNNRSAEFSYGALLIPVSQQSISPDSLFSLLQKVNTQFNIPILSVKSGFSSAGIDLGSNNFRSLKKPNAAMLVGKGISSYEAGEIWHLMDTRMHMPITKIPLSNFARLNLDKYNVLIMISGSYTQLDSMARNRLSEWIKKGNTLITSRTASQWAIEKKLVNEKLIKKKKTEAKKEGSKDTLKTVERRAYVNASNDRGKTRVGGAIFEVDLDLTHPLAFGYRHPRIPVYRNSTIWLAPSENPYSTVAKYTNDPHIDGFITEKNLEEFLKPSASLIVSSLDRGRVVLFADNPNFRSSWFGTNRLLLNAIFLGQHVQVPQTE